MPYLLKTLLLTFVFLFEGVAHSSEDNSLIIYVALSEVNMGGEVGTSEQLNNLINHYASSTGALKGALTKGYPQTFDSDRNIVVYNDKNIRFVYPKCNYISDALGCGVKNKHWTLKTYVHVGEKYSTLNVKLYDEKGREIGKGTRTAYGKIRYLPQWKLTVVNKKGGFGGGEKTEIFEMYPPKIEEIPPLLKPLDVHQAILPMYVSTKTYK